MATGRRTKKKLSGRPKWRQERSLKCRRRKAKLKASKRRAVSGAKSRRIRRGKLR